MNEENKEKAMFSSVTNFINEEEKSMNDESHRYDGRRKWL